MNTAGHQPLMTLQQTLDYARKLFVELWVKLSDNHPRLQELEGDILRGEVEETRAQVRRALERGQQLPPEWNELVVLEAVDAYLAEHSGTRSTGVDTLLGTPVRMESGRVYLLYRRPQGLRQAPVTNKVGHLRRWARYHRVLPDELERYQIECVKPSDYLLQRLQLMCENKERLKVAICRFEDGVELKLLKPQPPHFRVEALTEPELRWEEVKNYLERARGEGVHVLVLPELTVPPDLRLRIQAWLLEQSGSHSLLLVLPGTFHEPDKAGKPGEVVNRTELLDPYGQPVLEHCKLLRFGGWEEGSEDINTGKKIQLLSLPLGLLATPICLDFCEADQPIREIWNKVEAAWLLVPAMGDASSRRAHAAAAKGLFITRGSVTVLANQPEPKGKSAPGFVCESLKRDPTRWGGEQGAPFEVVEVDIRLEDSQGADEGGS